MDYLQSFKYGQLSFLINVPVSKQTNSLSVKIASINHVLRSPRTGYIYNLI